MFVRHMPDNLPFTSFFAMLYYYLGRAKTITNKFLNSTKSDCEGGRTVGLGRVTTIIE